MKKQNNDVILQFCTLVVFFIIITFAFAIFMGGHYTPGGGFVGGLLISSALLIVLIAYDIKTLQQIIPIDFKKVIAIGLMFCYGTPLISILQGKPFFTHTFGDLHLPLLGELHLHTAVLFDIGVMLAVIGTTLTIILTIGENE
ncbi:Na(+)/H(+) antiporter subunit B [Macrococcoides bohemicum]|uniref:Na(+)/H(+) antiporter subunit B n=1 Tax=Macrococcoides bohemicum TaxID=1903056 RepID=A0A4R5Y499_9STAP|nr:MULTISPECIES: Na(+)/H(+) antiporter subunit B [Macrococcus]ATD30880.1 Na(+)/H(+) antiporter subunit B [Macrococcus sp. IME1552]MBC9874609.1 Na(+)/H(+) antiporter subunit B [Macrococcus bohemicus]QRN49385.1 Na(+)/H(+) antiporter subunit B [Macrococcus bohemicus]QYA43137.1 Na(+)/H(+) antiporter subunit B [Macrococcus bohemicus]QYA45512.1 Na(+)/H(+) antiporter subunit B [Macrococcus bohemicus]